jgi:hypothetical protein
VVNVFLSPPPGLDLSHWKKNDGTACAVHLWWAGSATGVAFPGSSTATVIVTTSFSQENSLKKPNKTVKEII